jgi:hypothetical protein
MWPLQEHLLEQQKLLPKYLPLTLFAAPDFVAEQAPVLTLFALVNMKSLFPKQLM